MGNLNSPDIAKVQVHSAGTPAKTEDESPYPDKAPPGSASKPAGTATKDPRGNIKKQSYPRPKNPGVGPCGG